MIRSHLPVNLLPTGLLSSRAKIVYVVRDVRDTAMSLFHHMKEFGRCSFTLDEFLQGFLNGDLMYGSYFDHVSRFNQVLMKRDNSKVIHFEHLKNDMESSLVKIAEFFGKNYSPEELKSLQDHLDFKKMKDNPSVNLQDFKELLKQRYKEDIKGEFMRKGEVGSYKEEMSVAHIEQFQRKINSWDCKDLFQS